MKLKTTLVLLAIVVAVAAFIKLIEIKRPNTEEAKRQAGNVLNFDREKLEGIIIQNGDDKTELRLRDNKWRVESPIKDQADNGALSTLISDLESWHKDETIPAKEVNAVKGRLEEYGLSKPKLRLKLFGPGMPPEIFFGKEAALEGRMYVRFENSKETFIAANSVKNEIAKKPEDFRDRKLTELTAAQISRALVKTPAGEMELQKRADHWEIVKPLRARADDQKANDLLAQVTTARIEKFVADDRGDLHTYGLAEPRGSITLFPPDDKQGQVLQIGGIPEKEKEQVYVRFASRNAVYTLPKKVEEILNTKPNDLRDRHLVRFETNVLDRMTIDAPGANKTVLARKNENWTIANHNNQPANADEVNRLIETLKNEEVTKFVADVASELFKYGLDKPQLQLTLSSFASENTAETKSGEQPFATIAFGKTEGEDVYAHVGDEPFIVAVRRNLLEKIFVDPLRWQDVVIFRFKSEQVHRLSVVTDREQSITRGPKKEWKWLIGNGPINQTNVQSLLNTMTSLHAVRWVGATIPAHAFEKPQVAITFTTSPDDKSVHKLLVGAPNGEGMWFGKTDEHDGAFIIGNPDFNALKLPITNPPAPSPSPIATASPALSPVVP
jgi:uncharacterized protein DUF4340